MSRITYFKPITRNKYDILFTTYNKKTDQVFKPEYLNQSFIIYLLLKKYVICDIIGEDKYNNIDFEG